MSNQAQRCSSLVSIRTSAAAIKLLHDPQKIVSQEVVYLRRSPCLPDKAGNVSACRWQADERIIAHCGDGLKGHVAGPLDGPFVVVGCSRPAQSSAGGNFAPFPCFADFVTRTNRKARPIVCIERIQELLLTVGNQATVGFSGLGIIISDARSDLPITPLRPRSQLVPPLPTVEALLAISDQMSEYHDGFHVLSSSLQLRLISQYFSPPIAALTFPPKDRFVGGRYAAALFGSTLAGVIATGVVSTCYGIAVFVGGTEIFTAAPNEISSLR